MQVLELTVRNLAYKQTASGTGKLQYILNKGFMIQHPPERGNIFPLPVSV
jgi:hypothetical protein